MYKESFLQTTLIISFLFLLFLPMLVSGAGSGSTVITETSSTLDSVTVTGLTSKGGGTFAIDHPLDPKNKILYHSFVESPDVKNIYDGVTRLNKKGETKVKLPKYFETLNTDFRYLVTPIGKPSPNLYIKQGVEKNIFIIAGGEPNTRVSWQVTGIRHDPAIIAYPIVPEVEKGSEAPIQIEKGEYLFPEFYAQ